jgi:hypothetical protein
MTVRFADHTKKWHADNADNADLKRILLLWQGDNPFNFANYFTGISYG